MTDRIDTDAIRDEALIADRPGQCDRLTALADGVDEEMVRPTPCRHSIYHHGCPSCDRQDPEDR